MARIEVPDGEGLEASRIWRVAPHLDEGLQQGMDDELWARCAEHFSEPKLLELTVVAGHGVGVGRALQVLDVAVDSDVLWSREPATG